MSNHTVARTVFSCCHSSSDFSYEQRLLFTTPLPTISITSSPVLGLVRSHAVLTLIIFLSHLLFHPLAVARTINAFSPQWSPSHQAYVRPLHFLICQTGFLIIECSIASINIIVVHTLSKYVCYLNINGVICGKKKPKQSFKKPQRIESVPNSVNIVEFMWLMTNWWASGQWHDEFFRDIPSMIYFCSERSGSFYFLGP